MVVHVDVEVFQVGQNGCALDAVYRPEIVLYLCSYSLTAVLLLLLLLPFSLAGEIGPFIDMAALERCSRVSLVVVVWGRRGTNIAAISFFFCSRVDREKGRLKSGKAG